MRTFPEIGLSSPAKVRPSVDFPAPFLPVNAITSPAWNSVIDMLAKGKTIAETQILRMQHNVMQFMVFRSGRVHFYGASGNPCSAIGKCPRHAAEHLVRSAVGYHSADERILFRLAKHDDAVHQVEPHVDVMLHHHQRLMGLFEHSADGIVHFLTPSGSRLAVGSSSSSSPGCMASTPASASR